MEADWLPEWAYNVIKFSFRPCILKKRRSSIKNRGISQWQNVVQITIPKNNFCIFSESARKLIFSTEINERKPAEDYKYHAFGLVCNTLLEKAAC
jgi:hypothetical protein